MGFPPIVTPIPDPLSNSHQNLNSITISSHFRPLFFNMGSQKNHYSTGLELRMLLSFTCAGLLIKYINTVVTLHLLIYYTPSSTYSPHVGSPLCPMRLVCTVTVVYSAVAK